MEKVIKLMIDKKEKIAKNMVNLKEILYFTSLILILFTGYIGTTVIKISPSLYVGIQLVAAMLILLKVAIFDEYSVGRNINILFLLMLMYLTNRYAGEFNLYYYFYFILGSKGIEYKKIIKISLVFIGILSVITAALSLSGVIPNIKIGRNESSVLRFALGTIYPTDLAARCFYLMLGYVMLRKFKLTIPEYISLAAFTSLVFIVTDTKLDFILMSLIIISSFLRKKIYKLFNAIGFRWITLGVLGFIFSNILMAYIYSPSIGILKKIDNILTGRLYFGNLTFKNYNVTIFGQYIYQEGWGGIRNKVIHYFFIDSSYMRLLMMFGLVTFLIIIGLIIYLIRDFIINKKFSLLLALLLVLLSSAIDQHIVEMSYNIIFITLTANTNFFIEKEY